MTDFLMQPWAGVVIALLVIALACAGLRSLGDHVLGRLAMGGLLVVGLLMIAGAGFATWKWYSSGASFPAPGIMVQVDNKRLHVWCEGPPGEHTIVWLPGGYGQGLWLYPGHADIRQKVRSCLIDRDGLGWSSSSALPRGVESVIDDVRDALAVAGEMGPFVLVGHSFGGLYAANYAAKYRGEVAGIVLLDPTAPGWIDWGAAQGCGHGYPRPLYIFGSLFGLAWVPTLNPLLGPDLQDMRDALGELWQPFIANELRPSAFFSAASALHMPCIEFNSIVRAPGSLGETPMLLIPQPPPSEKVLSDQTSGLDSFEASNLRAFYSFVRTQMLAFSSNSRLVYAPEGAGHDFPRTRREFTRNQVLDFLHRLPSGHNEAGGVVPQ